MKIIKCVYSIETTPFRIWWCGWWEVQSDDRLFNIYVSYLSEMNADLVFSGNFLVENFYLNTFSFLDFDDLKIVHFFLASKLSLLENLYQTKTYIDDSGERYVKWNVFSSSDFCYYRMTGYSRRVNLQVLFLLVVMTTLFLKNKNNCYYS